MPDAIPGHECRDCGGEVLRKSPNGPLSWRCDRCKALARAASKAKQLAKAREATAARRLTGVWSVCIECSVRFRHSTKGPKPKWCPDCRYQRLLDRSSRARLKHEGPKTFACPDCSVIVTVESRRHNMRTFCRPCYERRRRAAIDAYWKRNPALLAEKRRNHSQRRRAAKRGAQVERFSHREIFERDGWVCGICHDPVDPNLRYPDPGSPSLDHIVPLSKGGSHTRDNVRLACLDCNVRRGNSMDESAA